MGEINAFAAVRHTLEHCRISHGRPDVPGWANRKDRGKAAVPASTPIILLTVRYRKTQTTGQLQFDNPNVLFSPLIDIYICLILTTSRKMYILQKDSAQLRARELSWSITKAELHFLIWCGNPYT